MSPQFQASEDYYAALEDSILETPRGRWFLREYAARCRAAETRRLLDVMKKLEQRLDSDSVPHHVEILRRELQDMSHSIVQTRQEIAAIKPVDPGNNRIMAATEELDAIVTATERATSDILTAAERLSEIGETMRQDGVAERLCDEIATLATNILMACSFQDITGQRTTKVVNVLRYLEQRVNTMIEIWGVSDAPARSMEIEDKRPDAHLLSGPAREGEGVSQDDVDRLFNGEELPDPPAAPPRTPHAPKAPLKRVNGHDLAEDEAGAGEAAIDQNAIDALFS